MNPTSRATLIRSAPLRTALILLTALTLTACTRDAEPAQPPTPAIELSSADDNANIDLILSADRTTITTLDRLRVTITMRRPVASSVTLIEPDWQAAGWTRTESTDTEPRALDADADTATADTAGPARIERARTITLEPYLPGTYTVPPATIEWTTDGMTRALQTPALDITVTSVLTADDDPALAAPAPPMPVPAEPKPNNIAGLIISVVVLASALLVWRLARRPAPQPEDTPADTIRAIANAQHPADDDLPDLHRALTQAEPMPSSRDALQALITRCERARFAPEPQALNPKEVAAAALELIATQPASHARSEHAEATP